MFRCGDLLSGAFLFTFFHFFILRFDTFQFFLFLRDRLVQTLQLLFGAVLGLIVTFDLVAKILWKREKQPSFNSVRLKRKKKKHKLREVSSYFNRQF